MTTRRQASPTSIAGNYNYDGMGRLSEGLTGGEARDFVFGTTGGGADGIYRQTYQYDAWDNLTGRAVNRFWSGGEPFADTFVNQRKQGSHYDAEGQETWDDYGTSGRTHTYDAAGRKVKTSERSQSAGGGGALALGAGKDAASTSAAGGGGVTPHMPEGGYYTTTTLTITQGYDGEGRSTKRVETKVQSTPWNQPVTTERVDYYVRSSVLGGRVVTELNTQGQKRKTNVYAGGEVIAEQDVYAGGAQGLTWKQSNPMTGTEVEQNTANGVTQRKEYDPFGLELGASDPYANDAEPDYASFGGGSYYRSGGNPFDDGGGCYVDQMPRSCSETMFLLGNNLAEQCPFNYCGARVVPIRNEHGTIIGEGLSPLIRDPNTGWLGYPDIVKKDKKAEKNPQKTSPDQFTAKQLEQFKSCLSTMFQVEYKGHNFARGEESYFDGYTNRGASFYSISSIGDFTVRTDQQSYSSRALTRKYTGIFGDTGGKLLVGYTDPGSPYVNAIANDAGMLIKGSQFLAVWVHELGNSLSSITRISPDVASDAADRYDGDTDAGTAFEDCVFGGRVKSDGSVSSPR